MRPPIRSRRLPAVLFGLAFSAVLLLQARQGNPQPGLAAPGATTYYVSLASGSDGNSGTSPAEAWQTVGRVNSASFTPGDSVLFERGSQWDEDLTVASAGAAGAPITFAAYGSGPRPILRRLTVDGDYTLFQDLTIDHQGIESDAVRVRARAVTLAGMTIRNGGRDGVDASDADGLLIDSCHIHHFLAGSFTDQQDAHGVVATDIQGLTLRDTEIHHVSGDSFQADPSRSVNVPTDILIEDSHFWTGPLAADFNAWNAGEVPGENAIDTKVAGDADWPAADRAIFIIRNLVAHGWINDGFISNRAVFNMKEKIEAVFDGVTVFDAEIGFRIRGTRGNANVTIQNAVLYDLERAIRAEDDLQNLIVYNSSFGAGIDELIKLAGGGGGVGTWDFRNNAFLEASPPSQAGHASNKTAAAADFVDSPNDDYHLPAGSSLIDAGVALAGVAVDRDGVGRPQGDGFDVGAYEFIPSLSLAGRAGDQTIFLAWSVNTTLPLTASWQISYDNQAGDQGTVTGIPGPARAHTLTGLVNYIPYQITLNAVVNATPILTGTVAVTPTDLFVYLPAALKQP